MILSEYYGNSKQFLKEVRSELRRVVWPTRKETLATTYVVLILVFFFTFYFGLLDFILAKIVKVVF
ncbi:MAG: preprotein translocase subunit SecE [Thermodesulfobacteriota bacterium]|nr:preprotein translocase subunit SecE [Thermodesulfobacteriota bacterium]